VTVWSENKLNELKDKPLLEIHAERIDLSERSWRSGTDADEGEDSDGRYDCWCLRRSGL